MEIALGESTTCIRRADGRVTCRGARPVAPTRLEGPLEVSDTAVCVRNPGLVRCLREGADTEAPSVFLEVVTGSGGATCGRDGEGAVWCWRGPGEDGAILEPVALPSAARKLVGATQTWVLLDDGRLAAFDPYSVVTGSASRGSSPTA